MGEEILLAPFTGVVKKIGVSVGERVTKGQSVFVLGSLYFAEGRDVSSRQTGIVEEVHVELGQTINTGEPLLTLK